MYLDNASTTKPCQEVVNCVKESLENDWYNPSSLYSKATQVHTKIKEATKLIASSIDATPDTIFFTSGATESNNWVLQGFVRQALLDGYEPIVITTDIEHNSIKSCCEYFDVTGVIVERIGVNTYGEIDEDSLASTLKYYSEQQFRRILVSIQWANNEIGIIQNIHRLADMVQYYGAYFHTDAVQIYGKRTVSVLANKIDFLSVSAHKIGGMKGTGFLYVSKRGQKVIAPLIYGSQNRHMRGGTENVSGILSFAEAVKKVFPFSINKQLFIKYQRLLQLMIENDIAFKHNSPLGIPYHLENICSITLDYNLTGEALIYLLDTKGIYISAGSACNSHSSEPSYVLKAIGLSDSKALRTIRISLNNDVTEEEIKQFVIALKEAIKILTQ